MSGFVYYADTFNEDVIVVPEDSLVVSEDPLQNQEQPHDDSIIKGKPTKRKPTKYATKYFLNMQIHFILEENDDEMLAIAKEHLQIAKETLKENKRKNDLLQQIVDAMKPDYLQYLSV